MSEEDKTLAEKMSDPNSVLYFFKVLSCLGNQGKRLKYEESIISSIEKDLICYGEGIPLPPTKKPVNITVYISYIGNMITCLKYEMTDDSHTIVQSGINNIKDTDVNNLTAGIEHFIKCSRKRKKEV